MSYHYFNDKTSENNGVKKKKKKKNETQVTLCLQRKRIIPSASPSINLQNYTQTIFLKFFKLFRVPPGCRLQNHPKTKDTMITGFFFFLVS